MNPSPNNLPPGSAGLNRRRFLRNLGVCLALPALESFLPRRLAAATTASGPVIATTAGGAPLRSAFIYFPNGAIPGAWLPTGQDRQFELNRTMKPLAKVKDKIQVFAGLTDESALAGADGGGDHARANGTFLTGVRIKKTGGMDFHAGMSVDQVMAQQIGLITPFRSLELSCDAIQNVGTCDTGYACVYQHNLSWSSPTAPMTPEVNPRLLFERLFGAGSRAERQQNLLVRQQQRVRSWILCSTTATTCRARSAVATGRSWTSISRVSATSSCVLRRPKSPRQPPPARCGRPFRHPGEHDGVCPADV